MALLEVKGRDGVKLLPLFEDTHEDVRLEQWVPGAAIEFDPNGGLEVLVLEGGFHEGGELLVWNAAARSRIGATAGGYRRRPNSAGQGASGKRQKTRAGCPVKVRPFVGPLAQELFAHHRSGDDLAEEVTTCSDVTVRSSNHE